MAETVIDFLERTSDLSTRKAGDLIGVSQTWVSERRQWMKRGADPETLPVVQEGTLTEINHFLGMADDLARRGDALRLAADRLIEVAEGMRKEASTLPSVSPAKGKVAASERRKGRQKKDDQTGTGGNTR